MELKHGRIATATLKKIQASINTCLTRIFRIHFPEIIRNRELWERIKQQPAESEILQRRWRWIGHTLQKPMVCTKRQDLTWNQQGKRPGRPRNTWRRYLLAVTKRIVYTWGQLDRLAKDRDAWRALERILWTSRGQRPMMMTVVCLFGIWPLCPKSVSRVKV